MSQEKQEVSKMEEQPTYAGIYELKDTAKMMTSPDYKIRFVAEYIQLKIRYEKLKYLLTRWEAGGRRFDMDRPCHSPEEYEKDLTDWLGFLPSCSFGLLKEQQRQMGELLHTLEVRSIIEGIDLRLVTIKL